MLADYDVFWFEEPLCPDNLPDCALLRRNAPLLIAGGEVLTRRQSFVPWLQGRALDIVQPDVTKAGGISEERRIAWMAEENGIRFIPHGWNTALGLAADLHLVSAMQHADLFDTSRVLLLLTTSSRVSGGWVKTGCLRCQTDQVLAFLSISIP